MKFEWDEKKNQENIKKHGLSFAYASYVFDDPYYIEEYDEKHSDDEERYDIIGMVDDLLFVVCTYRGKDEKDEIVRLISARIATNEERSRYYGSR